MISLAKHIKAIEPNVTVLQIQKVMYFALGNYMNINGIDSTARKVYTSDFEAWDLGPVNRAVYREYKQGNLIAEYQEELEPFTPYIEKYLKEDVYSLVDDSHKEGTHCWDYREEIQDRKHLIYYNLEDVLSDYKKIGH